MKGVAKFHYDDGSTIAVKVHEVPDREEVKSLVEHVFRAATTERGRFRKRRVAERALIETVNGAMMIDTLGLRAVAVTLEGEPKEVKFSYVETCEFLASVAGARMDGPKGADHAVAQGLDPQAVRDLVGGACTPEGDSQAPYLAAWSLGLDHGMALERKRVR